MKKIILLLLTCVFVSHFLIRDAHSTSSSLNRVYPVVIVGGGVGALTSSVYLARAQILPLVIEGKIPGGVITQSHLVQNWPGEVGISGHELGQKIKDQALANGAEFLSHEVIKVDLSKTPYTLTTRNLSDGTVSEIQTLSLIIAMGTTPNLLHIPGEEAYWGKGVTNCATCDGALYKNKDVVVIGGGDAAVLEAEYLSALAKKVYILVRKGSFATQDVRRMEAVTSGKNVEVLFNTTLEEIIGDEQGVVGARIATKGKERTLPIDGVFLAIGSKPNSEIIKGQVSLDKNGYVILKEGQRTSRTGVYAIGDIADPIYKQAISAAGDGAKAAMEVEGFLRALHHKDSSISLLRPTGSVVPLPTLQHQTATAVNLEASSAVEIVEIVSEAQFKKEINSSSSPVVVDFYATWCGPCKQISKDLADGAKDAAGKVKFLKVNVDKFPKLSQSLRVRSMPTLVIFGKQGKEIGRKVGTGEILSFLKTLRTLRADESSTRVEDFLKKA